MDFSIKTKSLSEISKEERRRLNYLTLRNFSLLRDDVLKAEENLEEFQLFFAVHNEKIIGWSAIFPGKLSTEPWLDNGRYYIYTYVQTGARRNGIGKALLGHASKWAQNNGYVVEVFAWNKNSEHFFTRCQQASLPIEVVIDYV